MCALLREDMAVLEREQGGSKDIDSLSDKSLIILQEYRARCVPPDPAGVIRRGEVIKSVQQAL